jgi:hypothetical protein
VPKHKRLNIYLTVKEHTEIKKAAADLEMSMNDLIDAAILHYTPIANKLIADKIKEREEQLKEK